MRILLPIVFLGSLVLSSFAQDSTSLIQKQDSLVPSSTVEEVIGAPESNHTAGPKSENQRTTANRDVLERAILKGKNLTTCGLVLHFVGLGVGTISGLTKGASPIVTYGSNILTMLSPIFACSGASSVDGAFHENGISLPESHQWKEYGKGWAFEAAGLGFFIGGTFIISSNEELMPGLILVIGGVVFSLMGEVTWIKAMVHSAVYVSKAERSLPRKPDISLVPYYDLKGKYGLVAQVGF